MENTRKLIKNFTDYTKPHNFHDVEDVVTGGTAGRL